MVRTALILLLLAGTASAQQPVRQALRGDSVAIYNLAGDLRVEGGSGADVTVDITLRGADADQLRAESGPIRGRETLRVIYPGDAVHYPALGRDSRSELRVRDDGTFWTGGDGRRGREVTISGRSGDVEGWADLIVRVPRGKSVAVYLAVGEVTVSNVDGELMVDVSSADITSEHTRGTLSLDTGSGNVTIADAEGDITLDTGSGDIQAANVRGASLNIDTGSGDVDVTDVTVGELSIDTGSGDVTARGVSSKNVIIDTGSGSIELTLRADVEQVELDSGSGSVTLGVPEGLGAELEIDTGSGEIEFAFPVQARLLENDHFEGLLGDGRGRITIDTSSGDVRVIRSQPTANR